MPIMPRLLPVPVHVAAAALLASLAAAQQGAWFDTHRPMARVADLDSRLDELTVVNVGQLSITAADLVTVEDTAATPGVPAVPAVAAVPAARAVGRRGHPARAQCDAWPLRTAPARRSQSPGALWPCHLQPTHAQTAGEVAQLARGVVRGQREGCPLP